MSKTVYAVGKFNPPDEVDFESLEYFDNYTQADLYYTKEYLSLLTFGNQPIKAIFRIEDNVITSAEYVEYYQEDVNIPIK